MSDRRLQVFYTVAKLLSFTKENQKSPILIKEVEDKLSLKIDDFKTKLSNYKERFLVDISDLNAYLKKLSNEDFLLQNNSKRVVELSQNNKGSLQTKFNIFQEKSPKILRFSSRFSLKLDIFCRNFTDSLENAVKCRCKKEKKKMLSDVDNLKKPAKKWTRVGFELDKKVRQKSNS